MPKLDRATAVAVNKADTGGQELLPAGEYVATLRECKVSPKKDRNQNSYWIWSFEITEEGSAKGTKLSTNTGLADNQHWWMKIVFDAFEAKPNVDTDTLVGKEVTLVVDQSEITGGPRKGKLRNEITSLMPKGAQAAEGDDDEFDEDKDGDDPDF
jgi:hypothetical protein